MINDDPLLYFFIDVSLCCEMLQIGACRPIRVVSECLIDWTVQSIPFCRSVPLNRTINHKSYFNTINSNGQYVIEFTIHQMYFIPT